MNRIVERTVLISIIVFLANGILIAQGSLKCGVNIGENYIAIEAEATTSPLGNWVVVNPNDPNYKDSDSVEPINQTYLEYRGTNSYRNPVSPLTYTFVAPKTTTYRMVMRLYQRLEGEESDKCNDVYIRLEGNFTSASSNYSTAEMKQDMKFYGKGADRWGVAYNYDKNHVRAPALYHLKKGEEYTFTMSGRSERTGIDYILFFDTSLDITVDGNKCLAEHNDAHYRPYCSEDKFALGVLNGTGDGFYEPNSQVTIEAEPGTMELAFDTWHVKSGNPVIENPDAAVTNLTTDDTLTIIEALYDTIPKYTLIVNNGTGTGQYFTGEEIRISANDPIEGEIFDKWVVETEDPSVLIYKLNYPYIRIPEHDVEVTATYVDDPDYTHVRDNLIRNDITVYPNPLRGNHLTLKMNNLGETEIVDVSIANIWGQMVFSGTFLANKDVVIPTDQMKDFSYYLLTINTDKGVFTYTLFKEQ